MTEVRIYLEGGGDSSSTRTKLRQGMDAFRGVLKDLARGRAWGWRVVPGGGRRATYDAFMNAIATSPDAINVLLVDSEDPVTASPELHLGRRDGWQFPAVAVERIHLMAQCMEAWIVADPDALARYYGKGFRANSLPRRQDLEGEPKPDIERKLKAATRNTQKGEYQKIRHASGLLAKIDPGRVRTRCRHGERLFATLGNILR